MARQPARYELNTGNPMAFRRRGGRCHPGLDASLTIISSESEISYSYHHISKRIPVHHPLSDPLISSSRNPFLTPPTLPSPFPSLASHLFSPPFPYPTPPETLNGRSQKSAQFTNSTITTLKIPVLTCQKIILTKHACLSHKPSWRHAPRGAQCLSDLRLPRP
jgi:hypothetical protein